MNPYEPPMIDNFQPAPVTPKGGFRSLFASWPICFLVTQGIMQIVGFFTAPASTVGLGTPTGQRVMFFAFDLRVGRDPAILVYTLLGIVIFSVVLCTGAAVLLVKRVSLASNFAAVASSAMLITAVILHFIVPSQALSWISGIPSYLALTSLLWYSLTMKTSVYRNIGA